jgi:hypothetical protein
MTFVLACFQASAAPRIETPDSIEKDALLALIQFFFVEKAVPHLPTFPDQCNSHQL